MNEKPRHIVSVSSGLGSAFTWKLVCDQFGPENVTGVFTDVNGEHPDNYRFLAEVQYELGSRLVKIGNDGRTIWDVMIEQRFLANTRVDICSRILKREAFMEWLGTHASPGEATVYLGIDWMEVHRLDRARPHWEGAGFAVAAPMCEPPYRSKHDAQAWLDASGIRWPTLYDLGFEHSNCGGGCVKAGVGQFRKLLLADRRWFTGWWEAGEERVRRFLGKDVAILRDRSLEGRLRRLGLTGASLEWVRGEQADHDEDCPGDREGGHHVTSEPYVRATGKRLPNTVPLTLRELREGIEAVPTLFADEPEGPGCGVCFLPGPNEEELPPKAMLQVLDGAA